MSYNALLRWEWEGGAVAREEGASVAANTAAPDDANDGHLRLGGERRETEACDANGLPIALGERPDHLGRPLVMHPEHERSSAASSATRRRQSGADRL